jgi:hypothetical protein
VISKGSDGQMEIGKVPLPEIREDLKAIIEEMK